MSGLYNLVKGIVMFFEPKSWDEFWVLDKIFKF